MPSSGTPFRAPPRQSARSQFASTPRFLLSQPAITQRRETENNHPILPEDDADQLPKPRRDLTPGRDIAPRRKEAIEDPSSDLDLEQHSPQPPDNGVGHGDIPSSPPPDMADVDAEIEDLFGPTRHRTKRRRVSVNLATPEIQQRKPHDSIETSSPEASPFATDPPSPSLPYRATPQKTPRPPPTPATSKPSIRNYPRFLVSSSTQPPPKPTFVLPRSPSPDQADDPNSIPTPFSPSSHALRRRGRQRSSAPSYLPDGMAAEVRSWVLQMGTKREQQIQTTPGRRSETDSSSVDTTRYSLMLRIDNVRQSVLGSCGPLAFIQGQAMESSEDNDSADNDTRNVLLMGAPRLRAGELHTFSRVPDLQAGDVVGVLRGLVWEIGVERDGSPVPGHEHILRCESKQTPGLGRWLVGMEWEVISSA
ncbi:hypothetical protein BDW62DRAFT_153169 [Aspergillus aurantiobrunneus]